MVLFGIFSSGDYSGIKFKVTEGGICGASLHTYLQNKEHLQLPQIRRIRVIKKREDNS